MDDGLDEYGNANAAFPVGAVVIDIPTKPTVLELDGAGDQCAASENALSVELSELHDRAAKL